MFPMVYSKSSFTDTAEYPGDTLIRQSILPPPSRARGFHPFSREIPFPLGPRQAGQSSPEINPTVMIKNVKNKIGFNFRLIIYIALLGMQYSCLFTFR